MERWSRLPRRLSPDTRALIAIAGVVVLANALYILTFVNPNPLGPRSGLVTGLAGGRVAGQPWIDPNTGFLSQAVSHRAALDWVHFHVPWWNPYEATGTPLAGEMQSAAFFPLTLLTILSNGQLWEHMLLEILAGCATYLLLRRISLGRWASLAGGIAFALNGTFAWFSHAPVNPVPFLPLLLLGIELAYSASLEGRRGGWWLIPVAGALSFYGGFPETAYIDTLLAVIWFAWRCGCLDRERLRPFIGKALAGAAVGTLLAAPLLIASVDYVNHADLGAHASKAYATGHLPGQALPQLLLPYVYGPILGYGNPENVLPAIWGTVGGYLTTSLLVLAFFGLLSRQRRGLQLLLLAWIVLAMARMYGHPHFLAQVIGVLPGMWRIAFLRYAFPALQLAVVVLAAIGLDDLARAPQSRRRLALGVVAALVLVAGAAVGARPLVSDLGSKFSHRPFYYLAVAWGVLAVAAVGVAALRRDARARASLLALVVAVDAFALFVAPEASAPRNVQLDLAPARFLQRHLGSSRFFTLGPLQPNYGSYFGIGSLNINDVPIPKSFQRYVHARLDQIVDPTVFVGNFGGGRNPFLPGPQQELLKNLDGYRAAGVSYVLTPTGQPLPQSPSSFQLVFQSPSARIYHLAGSSPYFTAGNRGCRLQPDGRTSVQVSCAGPSTLVRRETAMPGWSAHVDGRPVKVTTADGLFQSVVVPAGSHRVTFSYLPPYVWWGIAGFAVGCAWLLLAATLRRASRFAPTRRRLRVR